MSTGTISHFFGMLSLLTAAATLAVVVLAVMARMRPQSSASEWLDTIGDLGLWMGFAVAAVTMSGSLYYSLGAHFTPCELCWYQRICEYPLAVALLIAALRKDRDVWHYLVAPAVIGIIIASYQTQLQAYPKQHSFCQLANPCTTRYVWVFKFVSLPFMDLTALCFVLAMALVVRRSTRSVAAEPIAAEPLPERVPQGASA